MKNIQNKTEREGPDFKALHDAFQETISTNLELVEKVGYYANRLKAVDPRAIEPTPINDETPTSIVSLMWDEIDKMRFANDSLNHYINHLQSVIGDNK